MSIVKSKNFSYLKGPKGEKGDRGEPGTGVSNATGRITYNASTKTIGFNDTGLVTQEYVDTSISNLVNGAPGVLDTLQELSSAINNDANFFANITSTILGKLSLAGGTMTGDITLARAPTNNLHATTKEYVDTQIANLVDTAPAALDTLKELATALGNDANFATTIATTLGNKADISSLADLSLDCGDY